MRKFLGMANYFGKYVDRFSELCNSLRLLTKGSTAWTWRFEQQKAFQQVKAVLVNAPVLFFYERKKDADAAL